jgi:cell wall-associated NlpC family hydrolase
MLTDYPTVLFECFAPAIVLCRLAGSVRSVVMGLPEPVSKQDLRAKIVASAISTAEAAADTDYTVGGKTLSGFDCSGFVYYVLKQVFPDFNYLQAADLAASPLFVEVKAYRPGDLIFFPAGTDPYEVEKNSKSKTPSKLPAKVYGAHIGIVVDHGHWISSQMSTGPDTVAINNVWWGSRPKKFLMYAKLT